MSEVKLISPLLDGFSVGNPMSEHCGVKCCPAIKENTDKKYIVKIISIPASQVQMDALLLAGAYKDPADAMEYFRQIGEDILNEAERLKTLSKLDGFLPYEGWQMVPITRRRLGYEVYLVGSYKRSLEKHIKTHSMTHLEAINLGLDLCSALSIARESGAIYAALKPTNIFVSDKKEYRIGDLGFISLDALGYSTLSEKQLGPYTPPELHDPLTSLNLTVDTYAVGMILYRLYNDGQFPFKGKKAPEEELPSPVNADYELAEIIMKAIHPDPTQRWNDPEALGKALVSYMQKNSVNDVPITPYIPLNITSEKMMPLAKDALTEESDRTIALDEEEPCISDETESAVINTEESASDEATQDDSTSEKTIEEETIIPDFGSEEKVPPDNMPPSENSESAEGLSDEVTEIIEKADNLISHEIPDSIIIPVSDPESDPFAFASEDDDEIANDTGSDGLPEAELSAEKPIIEQPKKKKTRKFADPKYQRRIRRILSVIAFALFLCILGMLGFIYYQNIYLQAIDGLIVEGSQDQISVIIDSDIDRTQLHITCTDQFGNAQTLPAGSGKTTFSGLQSNTMYTIQVSTDGFHKLTGKTTEICTTDAQTNIVDFSYVVGSEDGSVLLNFTVNGKEPNDWTVFYSADGVEEKRKTFTGHSVSVSNLVIGKTYTFRLETGENISLSGETTLELLASKMILAENLRVDSLNGTDITVSWNAPGDVVVDNWTVKCYNDTNYHEQVTVAETSAVFTDIDPTSGYSIEVTASGMTQFVRTTVSANPITVGTVKANDSSYNKLKISWDHTGTAPKDGWLLTYSYVGGQKSVIKCAKASAEITPVIPGAQYRFTIQAADDSTVYNNTHSYSAPAADPFSKHGLSADKLSVNLLKTPDDEQWYFDGVSNDAITNQFRLGDSISIGMRSSDDFYIPGAEVDILYVIRDAYGNILPDLLTEKTLIWKNIWNGGDIKAGELDLPVLPATAGDYVLNLYFDGMSVAELNFTVS